MSPALSCLDLSTFALRRISFHGTLKKTSSSTNYSNSTDQFHCTFTPVCKQSKWMTIRKNNMHTYGLMVPCTAHNNNEHLKNVFHEVYLRIVIKCGRITVCFVLKWNVIWYVKSCFSEQWHRTLGVTRKHHTFWFATDWFACQIALTVTLGFACGIFTLNTHTYSASSSDDVIISSSLMLIKAAFSLFKKKNRSTVKTVIL